MKGLLLTLGIGALTVACGGSESTGTSQVETRSDETEIMQTIQEADALDSMNQEILESSEVLDALLKEIN